MKFCRNLTIPRHVIFTAFKLILKDEILDGENIEAFELAFRRYIGTKYAVATSSAQFAMYLVFQSLDIQKGIDEIILPAFMPWNVAKVAMIYGLRPVFVDVDPETRNIDPQEIEKKITAHTKIIMAIHLFGVPCDIERIARISRDHHIILIENCAQAIGGMYKGKKLGSFGDVGIFSFGKEKTCTTYGGGMVVTNDTNLHDRLRAFIRPLPYPSKMKIIQSSITTPFMYFMRTPWWTTLFTYPFFSFVRLLKKDFIANQQFKVPLPVVKALDEEKLRATYAVKYTNLQAVSGLIQLHSLDARIRNRNANAAILNARVPKPPLIPQGAYPSYFLYCIKVEDRGTILNMLFDAGILTQAATYAVPPDMEVFHDFRTECPNARELQKKLVFLPVQSSLGEREMDTIASVVIHYYRDNEGWKGKP